MLTNPYPKTSWAAGDTVFYLQPFSEAITNGTIQAVVSATGGMLYARVHNNEHLGNQDIPFDRLFETHDSAMDALIKANDARQATFEAEIKTINDLVQFGYTYTVSPCEEYTDWVARAAYRAKAKALLGIDLSA